MLGGAPAGARRDAALDNLLQVLRPGARTVSGWPERCMLAHAFLWEYSCHSYKYKGWSWPNFWANLASFSLVHGGGSQARHLRHERAELAFVHTLQLLAAHLALDYLWGRGCKMWVKLF